MMPTEFDTLLLPIYRSTTRVDDGCRGELHLADADLVQAFNAVLLDPRKFGVFLKDEPCAAYKIGDKVNVELSDPSLKLGLVAGDFDAVLDFPRGRSVCPRFYWLAESLAYSDEASLKNPTFARYSLLLEFVNLLTKAAAYFEKDSEELIFLKDGKVCLPVLYSAQELNTFDQASLSELLSRFADNNKLHEQLLSILAESVLKQISSVETKRRFTVLLNHLPEILKSVDDGYRLYVANFSYEKVRDELQSAKIEELTKIHKAFADVQGQILGIPLATVLVATQFKSAKDWGDTAWINSAVLLGVWVFSVLMLFVIRNQRNTLDAISQEICRKKEKVEKDYAKVTDLVSGIFADLEGRLNTQYFAFKAVEFIVVICWCLAHVAYFALTQPAWAGLKSFIWHD